MGVYTGFGYTAPAGAVQEPSDPNPVTLGCRFQVTQSGLYASAIRFYAAGTLGPTTRVGALYSSDSVGAVTNLAQANFPASTTSGWKQVVITPVALTSGVDYYAAVFWPYDFPTTGYSSVASLHDSAVVNGPVTIVANSGSTPNSTYNYSSALAAPRDHYGTAWYCIDIEVNDGKPAAPPVAPRTAAARASAW